MVVTELSSAWEKLNPAAGVGDGYVRLRLPSVAACATYAGRSISDGREVLILEIATASLPTSSEYPQSLGFELRSEALAPGRFGKARLLLLGTQDRFRDIFHALCEDIVRCLSTTSDEPEAVRTFVSRLARWQTFLKKHEPGGLSAPERRGLFGELFFLRQLLAVSENAQVAVDAWRGCRGENHDFQLLRGSVEVKTTSANTPHSFRISNVGQLNDHGVEALYLHLIMVEENEGGTVSLPELLDQIRAELAGNPLSAFEESLLEVGYFEVHQSLYSSPRYSLRSKRYFHVTEGFPRLLDSALPPGVEDVTYAVAIAACKPFETDESQVMNQILQKVVSVDE
jgi:hypothetical protein